MEDRVSELRHVIASTIKGPSVLQFLVPTVISQCEGTALKRLYHSSTEKANHRLLDLVYISDAPGKWTAFLDALQHAEYPYLSRLLQSTDNRTFNTCSKLIDLFASELELRIKPAELLAALRSKDVISDIDRQEIMAKQTNQGAVEGAMLLLDRIQIHLEPGEWYSRVLKILDENNQRDLVELIDPSFYDEPEVEEVDKETILHCIIVGDRGETRRKCTIKGNKKITATINEYRGEIVELLRADKIVSHLVPDVISRDQASLLRQMEDQSASTQKLLDIVMQEPDSAPGFVRGLQDAGFPYLAKLLSDPGYVNNCQYLRKMMSIFEPTIQRLISPADVMGLLVSEELITNKDKDEILSERETHGDIAAVMLMLDCLQCRLEPHIWYTKLLQILVKTDHSHVVKILDPDYLANPDIFTQKLCKFYASRGGDGLQSTDMRCPMLPDISAAIGFFQKQDNKLLTSANIVKQQIITAKKPIGAIVERPQDEFAGKVQRESQNIKQKAKRLQEIRDELNKSSAKHSILSSECLELIEESHKTIAITFTPNTNVTSIGDLSVSERIGMPEPGNEMYTIPAPVIPTFPVETKSSSGSSASFLEVSEYQRSQMSEYESSQHGDTDIQEDFDINDEFSYFERTKDQHHDDMHRLATDLEDEQSSKSVMDRRVEISDLEEQLERKSTHATTVVNKDMKTLQIELSEKNKLEKLQKENADEWGRRERLETDKLGLERDNKKLRAQISDLEEQLERKSTHATTVVNKDMKTLQIELSEKNKELADILHIQTKLKKTPQERTTYPAHSKRRCETEVKKLRSLIDELMRELTAAEDEELADLLYIQTKLKKTPQERTTDPAHSKRRCETEVKKLRSLIDELMRELTAAEDEELADLLYIQTKLKKTPQERTTDLAHSKRRCETEVKKLRSLIDELMRELTAAEDEELADLLYIQTKLKKTPQERTTDLAHSKRRCETEVKKLRSLIDELMRELTAAEDEELADLLYIQTKLKKTPQERTTDPAHCKRRCETEVKKLRSLIDELMRELTAAEDEELADLLYIQTKLKKTLQERTTDPAHSKRRCETEVKKLRSLIDELMRELTAAEDEVLADLLYIQTKLKKTPQERTTDPAHSKRRCETEVKKLRSLIDELMRGLTAAEDEEPADLLYIQTKLKKTPQERTTDLAHSKRRCETEVKKLRSLIDELMRELTAAEDEELADLLYIQTKLKKTPQERTTDPAHCKRRCETEVKKLRSLIDELMRELTAAEDEVLADLLYIQTKLKKTPQERTTDPAHSKRRCETEVKKLRSLIDELMRGLTAAEDEEPTDLLYIQTKLKKTPQERTTDLAHSKRRCETEVKKLRSLIDELMRELTAAEDEELADLLYIQTKLKKTPQERTTDPAHCKRRCETEVKKLRSLIDELMRELTAAEDEELADLLYIQTKLKKTLQERTTDPAHSKRRCETEVKKLRSLIDELMRELTAAEDEVLADLLYIQTKLKKTPQERTTDPAHSKRRCETEVKKLRSLIDELMRGLTAAEDEELADLLYIQTKLKKTPQERTTDLAHSKRRCETEVKKLRSLIDELMRELTAAEDEADTQANHVRKIQRSNGELQEHVENLLVQIEHLQSILRRSSHSGTTGHTASVRSFIPDLQALGIDDDTDDVFSEVY